MRQTEFDRAGIPGQPAPRRRAGVPGADPALPRLIDRRRRLDHRQPGPGRGGGAGCLAGGVLGHRRLRGPLESRHLGVQHRAEPRPNPRHAGRTPGRPAGADGGNPARRTGGGCVGIQAGRPLDRRAPPVGRDRPGANRRRPAVVGPRDGGDRPPAGRAARRHHPARHRGLRGRGGMHAARHHGREPARAAAPRARPHPPDDRRGDRSAASRRGDRIGAPDAATRAATCRESTGGLGEFAAAGASRRSDGLADPRYVLSWVHIASTIGICLEGRHGTTKSKIRGNGTQGARAGGGDERARDPAGRAAGTSRRQLRIACCARRPGAACSAGSRRRTRSPASATGGEMAAAATGRRAHGGAERSARLGCRGRVPGRQRTATRP